MLKIATFLVKSFADIIKTKMETLKKKEAATKDTLGVLPETVQDDYTASIELSNACREFYTNRLKATESFKKNLGCGRATGYRRTSIDDAMEKLRNEMVRGI